jgi:hypothetical protein
MDFFRLGTIIPGMLKAGLRSSRQRRVASLPRPLSVSLWIFSLLCFAASATGQATPAQKSTAASAVTEAFHAAGIGTGSRTIDGLWQFHTGDDPHWARPDFDDSGWERLPADKPWGDDGHPVYTGFAWYRRQIALDPSDKNPLGLYLMSPFFLAEVYWNGVRVGGVGALPPHAVWYFNQPPVAIPLLSPPGAGSGTLAFRVWALSDAGSAPAGPQEAPKLGYAPLIQKMAEKWVERRLHVNAVMYGICLIQLCVGLAALVLWLRSRSQWILLWVGAYFVSIALGNVLMYACLSLSVPTAEILFNSCDWINHTAFLFLILLLAGLPNRPGIRGFRFWKRICVAASALVLLGAILNGWQALWWDQPPSALSQFLNTLPDIRDSAEGLSLLLILIACLVLCKPRLPRLLFVAAAGLEVFLGDLVGFVAQYRSLDWLVQLSTKSLFDIYGAPVQFAGVLTLLLLAAIVYAVWDQLSRDLAEQRRANAELKAAQEVQKVLIAAEERGAPGYAVASVYRPASEVGGDFFQVIPLEEDGTLIVAGDVSGKGLRAAMTVSLIVGAVRTLAEQDSSPGAVLAGLNRRLVGRTKGGFATCCAVRVDPAGHAAMANAGHCQPYLDDREVELPAGLPLGLVDGMTYEEVVLTIAYGQQLTLVSDGVVEARNHRGELYGFDRLSQLMRQRPSAERVADTAIDFGQDDDITVLTVTRLSPEPDAAVQLSELSPAPA